MSQTRVNGQLGNESGGDDGKVLSPLVETAIFDPVVFGRDPVRTYA